MGNYYVPIKFFLTKCFDVTVLSPKAITSKTIELGCKYSPDFVCMPFKYTIGTLITALNNGANILFQAGGGCRYGYYGELQEQILRDLGYDFIFINLNSGGNYNLSKLYKLFKTIDNKFNWKTFIKYLFITSKMIKYMDNIDHYIRANIGFEVKKNSFINLQKQMLIDFAQVNNYLNLRKKYNKYFKLFKKIRINKPKTVLKVGIIGELYTVMEPYANYFLEKELAQLGIEIKRFTNVYYLLFKKSSGSKKYLKYAREYVKYKMGADATDNIGRCKFLCCNKYDGIIHIKSSFCTPEIGAMPIINRICQSYNVPIIYFSFDANTSETGIKTRLEAFCDIIEMRKKR